MPSDDLIAHELKHTRQQTNPQEWWEKYLKDPVFRLEQEIDAYVEQYKHALEFNSRQYRRHLLKQISKHLSGPIYGQLITTKEAEKLIKEGARL
jgi:hypothetical protein